LNELDRPTRALVELAAAIAAGAAGLVERCSRACVAAPVPDLWVDELLLQSVLMVGWPRALTAAAIWRAIGPAEAVPGEDATASDRNTEWRERGEAVCRMVYGANYARLRANVAALHPALESWMVTEGYGRTIGRPGLDLARRELCVVAQVAVQGAERQLHSHLKGAVHAGASVAVIDAVLNVVRPMLGADAAALAQSLWSRIRK
jgi:4-carboxymuconolactone decarboxylase